MQRHNERLMEDASHEPRFDLMKRGTASVSIKDVARTAKVSVGTVSRVMNELPNISPENIDRVKKAIKKLGYTKCFSAGQLASRRNGSGVRTGNVGLVFVGMGAEWTKHALVSAYTTGVELVCQTKGLHVMVELLVDGTNLPRCVSENKIDGLMIKATRGMPAFADRLPADLPVVAMGINDPSATVSQTMGDDRGAGWAVANHLWERGHRRFGFVNPDAHHPLFAARGEGFDGYLRTKGGTVTHFDGAVVTSPTIRESAPPDLFKVVERFAKMPAAQRPTAMATANDWTALGLINSLTKAGFKVPQDLSVIGFDNDAICQAMNPPLSSYAMPFQEVAESSATELVARIENPALRTTGRMQLIRGRLVERASVADIRAAGSSAT